MEAKTRIRRITLDYDVIEIHYNKNLKKKPYLARIFNYNNNDPNEIRLEENEIKDLYNLLKKYGYL